MHLETPGQTCMEHKYDPSYWAVSRLLYLFHIWRPHGCMDWMLWWAVGVVRDGQMNPSKVAVCCKVGEDGKKIPGGRRNRTPTLRGRAFQGEQTTTAAPPAWASRVLTIGLKLKYTCSISKAAKWHYYISVHDILILAGGLQSKHIRHFRHTLLYFGPLAILFYRYWQDFPCWRVNKKESQCCLFGAVQLGKNSTGKYPTLSGPGPFQYHEQWNFWRTDIKAFVKQSKHGASIFIFTYC